MKCQKYWFAPHTVPSRYLGEIDYFGKQRGEYCDTMPSFWKNMSVIKQIEVMSIIDLFFAETPGGKSP